MDFLLALNAFLNYFIFFIIDSTKITKQNDIFY